MSAIAAAKAPSSERTGRSSGPERQGRSTDEIREATGHSAYWIRTLIRRYNAEGEAGLLDRRRAHPGRRAHAGAEAAKQAAFKK